MSKGTVFPFSGKPKNILISNGRILDPESNTDSIGSIALADGKIVAVGTVPESFVPDQTIDATDCWITPGLVDLNVHLREPGREDKETIASGTAAAVAGGFTAIAAMPDTDPVADSEAKIRYLGYRSEHSPCHLYPLGAITIRLENKELAPYGEMHAAGAKGIAAAGVSIPHTGMLKNAMNYSRNFDLPFFAHCEDRDLSEHGAMNESSLSSYMGLPGSPSVAEDIDVARHCMLAGYTGARIHITHVSTRGAVDQIREAKKRGVKVTAETAPHYFSFTEDDIELYQNNKKVNPPLRSEDDRLAIIDAIKDGTIDVIASDHEPHTIEDKTGEFDGAEFGVSGLETIVAVTLSNLVECKKITPLEMVVLLSQKPNEIIGVENKSLAANCDADITIINPKTVWDVDTNQFHSKGRTSAFAGDELTGEVVYTIRDGVVVFER